MKRIAIFASGSGTNAENLVTYFMNHTNIECVLMLCDNKDALVFERMKKYKIPSFLISNESMRNGEAEKLLNDFKIDFILLAGFLKLIPSTLINLYYNKIVNIHPSLLPKYGGKGMYGMHIHNAVVEANDSITGITIHFVNKNFDEGTIIAQHKVELEENETPQNVALKIHQLEMKWFPKEVEKLLTN